MSATRDPAARGVDARCAAGTLAWETRRDAIAPSPTRGLLGECVEGQEDDGEPPSGQPWSAKEGRSDVEDAPKDSSCAGGWVVMVGQTTRRRMCDSGRTYYNICPANRPDCKTTKAFIEY